jgi:hypothetical protein
MTDSQLARLVQPFPDRLIHKNPSGGGQYVKHSVVKQKLLAVTGTYTWEIQQVIRGTVAGIQPNPQAQSKRGKEGRPELHDAIVGCIGRLTLRFEDGRIDWCDGAGDCEEPHNWAHDGQRLKDAESDAFKRASSHFGVGLHLWAPGEFVLADQLADREDGES